MTRSVVMSYADAQREFNKRQDPKTGTRTIGRYVITKDGDDYVFSDKKRRAITYGRLSPDNVFTLTLSLYDVNHMGYGGSNLFNVLPFVIHRLGSGKYGVKYTTTELKRYIQVKDSIIYDRGLKFYIKTGKCLNPKRPFQERINRDVYSRWLRDRKEFLAKVAVLERLGFYQGQKSLVRYIKTKNYMDVFVECVKEKRVDTRTLISLIKTDQVCIYVPEDYESKNTNVETVRSSAYKQIKELLSENSLALRQAYGVFDDE